MTSPMDKDLATLREYVGIDYWRGVLAAHETDATPAPCRCADKVEDAAAALDRVEAELARLTARRSRYAEARYENCMEALSAAEAELSRLREERDALAEALTAIRDCAKWYGEGERLPLEVHHALVVEVYAVADMALAGPDTPAEETT